MAKYRDPKVRVAKPYANVRRSLRSPSHPFQIRTRPFQIQPFLCSPVLPGETLNKQTQYVIDHYQIDCPDEEAAIIEDIMNMNGGSDKDIIIENLRGWFEAKKPADKFLNALYQDVMVQVDWEAVYEELKRSIIR